MRDRRTVTGRLESNHWESKRKWGDGTDGPVSGLVLGDMKGCERMSKSEEFAEVQQATVMQGFDVRSMI